MSHRRRMSALALLASTAVAGALLVPTAATSAPTSGPADPAPRAAAGEGSLPGVLMHLHRFEEIGDEHGDRAAGTPGYRASRDYVVRTLKKAGYRPKVQAFDYTAYSVVGDPAFGRTAPESADYVDGEDFLVMSYSGSSDVTAPVQAVDLTLDDLEGSTSGCQADDYVDFADGAVALVRRGGCSFGVKAATADAAGAAALLVMNQGTVGNRGLFDGQVGDARAGLAVLAIDYDLGVELATAGTEVRIDVETEQTTTRTWNVLADTRGNAKNVVVAGAHLDSVPGVNGLNDNASGSAALLEIAEQMATRKKAPNNRVRFAWWGAEEVGLLGSLHYVDDLAANRPKALRKIALYLNFDMIASPNYALQVYDGDNSLPAQADLPPAPAGSGAIERLFHRFFDKLGTGSSEVAVGDRSDHAGFLYHDIPIGGLFTGAEELKTEEEAALFGGQAGLPYDACYHEPCDDLGNVSLRALKANFKAMKHAIGTYAKSTKAVDREVAAAGRR